MGVEKIGTDYSCTSWDQELEEIIIKFKGDSFMARLGEMFCYLCIFFVARKKPMNVPE